MRKAALTGLALAFVFGWVLYVSTPTARALPAFKKEFDLKYVKKDSTEPKEKALVAEVDKAKCNVCHEGKDKKKKNAYGKALDVYLDKKTDAKDPAKIQESLEKVAKETSDPADANSPTFGELISEGKLPGGEPAPEEEAAN